MIPLGAAILPAVRKFAEQLGGWNWRSGGRRRPDRDAHHRRHHLGHARSAAIADRRLRAEHPQLTMSVREIDSVEALPALASGDIDLAFARLEASCRRPSRHCRWHASVWQSRLPRDHAIAKQPHVRLQPRPRRLRDVLAFSEPEYIRHDRCRLPGPRLLTPRDAQGPQRRLGRSHFVGVARSIALVPTWLRRAWRRKRTSSAAEWEGGAVRHRGHGVGTRIERTRPSQLSRRLVMSPQAIGAATKSDRRVRDAELKTSARPLRSQ